MLNKKYITIIIITVVVAITVFLVAFFVIKNSKKPNNLPVGEQNEIEILCNDITLFIDETKDINFQVIGAKDYKVDFAVSNENIKIENNKIIPNKVGKSTVTIKIVEDKNLYSKNFVVEVLPSVKDANIFVSDQNNVNVTKVFVGEFYILNVVLSTEVIDSYEILTSENISNFSKINSTKTKLQFLFKVNSYGETNFVFKYRKFEKTFTIDCYEFINNFNVKFSKNTKNLYIFNENYKNIAQLNEIHSSCSFEITPNANTLNSYSVVVEGNAVILDNNTLVAQNEGKSNLIISANDGSGYYEKYEFVVEKIFANDLHFDVPKIELNVNESYTFSYSYSPIYACVDITIFGDENISISNNTISSSVAGDYTLYIKDNLTNKTSQMLVKVKQPQTYTYQLEFNKSFMLQNNATFENDVLTVCPSGEDVAVIFSYSIVGTSEYTLDIQSNIEISTDLAYNINTNSNAVMINISGKGEAKVTLSLKSDSTISYSFTIVVI